MNTVLREQTSKSTAWESIERKNDGDCFVPAMIAAVHERRYFDVSRLRIRTPGFYNLNKIQPGRTGEQDRDDCQRNKTRRFFGSVKHVDRKSTRLNSSHIPLSRS